MRVAVLVTCYNRKAITIAGLSGLVDALSTIPFLESVFVVVDDGSMDGTGAAITGCFPDMTVVYGDGNLFWNGGMCQAFQVANRVGPFDAYLLFNDDVLVDTGAVQSFFAEYRSLNADAPAILAAATVDADGTISYSGMKRISHWRPLAVARLAPNGSTQRCDTFNGNFVLVPGPFFQSVGGLDPHFKHAYGDVDLGYRAAKVGIPIWLAGTPIGQCNAALPMQSPATKRERRLQRLRARWLKGDSLRQRIHFTLRHAPAPMSLALIVGATIKRIQLKLAEHLP